MKLLSLILLLSSACFASELRIAAIGDSITSGTFADSGEMKRLGRGDSVWDKIVQWLFNAPQHTYFEAIERSLKQQGYQVYAKNYALAGATIKDAVQIQVPQIIYDGLNDGDFDAVFVMIGQNDACDFTQDYENDQEQLLTSLDLVSRNIYVVPVPKIYELYTVKNMRTKWLFKAETAWKLHHLCDRLTLDGARLYDENRGWIEQWNRSMKDSAHALATTHWIGSVEHEPFNPKFVSNIDAFHVNREGHLHLSRLIMDHVRGTIDK